MTTPIAADLRRLVIACANQQRWEEHFRFENGIIIPLTAEGRVTVKLLRLNDSTRIQERLALRIGVTDS